MPLQMLMPLHLTNTEEPHSKRLPSKATLRCFNCSSLPFPTRRSSDLTNTEEPHSKRLPSKATLRWFNCSSMLVQDRKSTRLNYSHLGNSYAVFCLKKMR